jgi:hypothetical protein
LHSGRKREFLSIREFLRKIIFWEKMTFLTKNKVGRTYFCQPNIFFGPE